ncbi:MAG: glycosyltransferase [Bryobacteraceae bacterium]
MTVVIPTLAADETLTECVDSLGGAEIIVVDNSGRGLARKRLKASANLRVIDNRQNVGFGSAINQGIAASSTPYIAALNDDAVAHSQWLSALVEAAEAEPRAGMCASQVRMMGSEKLDSAGMLICADGSSRQRGHGQAASAFTQSEEVLLPSGSAALYRRAMIDQIGGFDDDFFLTVKTPILDSVAVGRAGLAFTYRRRSSSIVTLIRPDAPPS